MRKISDITYGEFERNKLDLYLPDTDSFSIFIYFHGGGLESGSKDDTARLADYLTSRNIAVVGVNYRMYPTAVYPEFIRDAAAAVAWVHTHINEYGACDKLFIGGSSAGGYISMMLCFDKKYLAPYGINPADISGFFHDAGQPTTHFNILRERGIDSRRIIIDEAAPLYHIGTAESYAPMHFVVSDNDMENRYEQTLLVMSTLKHFGYDENKYSMTLMHGGHCQYCGEIDENGDNILATLVYKFIDREEKR